MTGTDSSDATPKVSVIVLSYQSGGFLPRCLAAARAQTFRDYELILADNGSSDGAPQAAKTQDPGLILVENGANLGFAEGNNRAARVARGEWLVFLNPDAFAAPDFLQALMEAVDQYRAYSLFTACQRDAANPTLLDGAGDVMTGYGLPYRAGPGQPVSSAQTLGEVFAACGAAMMIRRDVFLDLGGFDPDFFCYCEDMDLSYRARLEGHRVAYVPTAVVDHMGSATLGVRSDFAVFHGVRNRLWLFFKVTPPVLLAFSLPLHLLATVILGLAALRGPQGPVFMKALQAAFKGLPGVFRKRKTIGARRRRNSLSIIIQMTWSPWHLFGRKPDIRPVQLADHTK
ncbi:MAG: glycosyltransferase family 2 protein [Asticcacaulis sp.]